MNSKILLEVFPLIFCIFYLMVFGISREMIERESTFSKVIRWRDKED